VVLFSRCKSTAEASAKVSAGGSASVVIETNAGKGAVHLTYKSYFFHSTNNVLISQQISEQYFQPSEQVVEHLQASSPLHLVVDQHQVKATPLRKKLGKQQVASKKSIM
jgi:hypothetical protein